MRKVLTAAAVAAIGVNAVKAAKASSESAPASSSTGSSSESSSTAKAGVPILTISGTYDFLKSSVFLTMDLVSFSAISFTSVVMEQLPPPTQKQVYDMYDDAMSQVDTLRIQNGIPTFSAMKKDAMREYEKLVQPQVDMVWKQVKTLSAAPSKILKNVVSKFEKDFPSSKGLLSGDIFDFALIIFFLVYYVLDMFISLFCYVCCCGACAKRKESKKKGTPSAVPATAITKHSKKKN